MGAYSREVPSMRTAPVATTRLPPITSVCMPPQVPTRISVRTPVWHNSSTPMAVEGPPMPVDMTSTFSPSRLPSQVVYSRFWW